MLDNLFEMETEPSKPELFTNIPRGLTVIDVDGKKVGTVMYYQPPPPTLNPPITNFPPELRTNNMPDELIFRLLSTGFICVNAGLLARDRFVYLFQVDSVTDSEVHLTASMDSLHKA